MTYSRTWGLWFDCLNKQKENAHNLLHTLGSWVIYYVLIEFQNGKKIWYVIKNNVKFLRTDSNKFRLICNFTMIYSKTVIGYPS